MAAYYFGGVSMTETILQGLKGKKKYQINRLINMDYCNVFVVLKDVKYTLMRLESVPSPFHRICSLPIGYLSYNTKKTTRIFLVPRPNESCKIIIEEKNG